MAAKKKKPRDPNAHLGQVQKELSEAELTERRDQLTDALTRVKHLREEKRETSADLGGRIKKAEQEIEILRSELKAKAAWIDAQHGLNFPDVMANTPDEEGEGEGVPAKKKRARKKAKAA